MRTVLEIFKNEVRKSYCENKRLQENLRGLWMLCRQEADTYPAYHAACYVLGALYKTAKVCDVVVKNATRKYEDDAKKVAEAFSWEFKLPQSFYRSAFLRKAQVMSQEIDIPQYYGGLRRVLSLRSPRFAPRRTSTKYKSPLLKKLASLVDGISNRILQERYICCIENEVIPYIFSNINNLHRIKEISAEEQAEVFDGFKNILRKAVSTETPSFFKVHCVDIRNLESRVEKGPDSLCVASKMNTRFALMYYGRKGIQKAKFVNYEFELKFNHFFDEEEHTPLLVEVHFEPLKY